jgi:uncharacterized protein YbjT (DUF2867 family)
MMNILVLGGNGFIGSAIVRALSVKDVDVTVATRKKSLNQVVLRMQTMLDSAAWIDVIEPFDIVVNAVGILRPRLFESYDDVHANAPAALAEAIRQSGKRLIHISALDLQPTAKSGFILSKIKGEQAIIDSQAEAMIVRPSLLDGEGGFGARWLRLMAKLPIYFYFNGLGKIAPLQVDDLGEAIANLCVNPALANCKKIIELGGKAKLTIPEYLAELNAVTLTSKIVVKMPKCLVALVSILCDCLYLTPLSFGHFELLQGNNVPKENMLPILLGRCPLGFGVKSTVKAGVMAYDAKVPL